METNYKQLQQAAWDAHAVAFTNLEGHRNYNSSHEEFIAACEAMREAGRKIGLLMARNIRAQGVDFRTTKPWYTVEVGGMRLHHRFDPSRCGYTNPISTKLPYRTADAALVSFLEAVHHSS